MKVEDPCARMLEFINDIFVRLEGVGYSDFKDTNPEKTIQLIQEKVSPLFLKSSMAQHLEYQQGLKQDLKAYVKLLCKETKISDRVSGTKAKGDTGKSSDRTLPNSKKKSPVVAREEQQSPRKSLSLKLTNGFLSVWLSLTRRTEYDTSLMIVTSPPKKRVRGFSRITRILRPQRSYPSWAANWLMTSKKAVRG